MSRRIRQLHTLTVQPLDAGFFEGGEGGQEGEAGSRKQRIGPGSTRARRGQASFRAAKGRCRASHEPDYIGISFREPVVVDSLKRIRF